MNKSNWENVIKYKLTNKRYVHTLGVAKTAVILAKKFGEDEEKAYTAAMLHDYAKCMSIPVQRQFAAKLCDVEYVEGYSKELLHAFAGAYLAENELQVSDQDVLQAIMYHTTGAENMTKLEKIIFLADYIEPNRSFPGVEKAREVVNEDLDKGMLHVLSQTINYLIEKKQRVFPKTIDAYNYYVLVNKPGGK